MLQLTLYSTDHCTLCDKALDMLLAMPELVGHQLLVADITTDDVLLEAYGEHIPVLTCGGHRLDAPFGEAEVKTFVADCLQAGSEAASETE